MRVKCKLHSKNTILFCLLFATLQQYLQPIAAARCLCYVAQYNFCDVNHKIVFKTSFADLTIVFLFLALILYFPLLMIDWS